MKFSREEFRINFASLRLHSTARALAFSLFLWIVWEMMGYLQTTKELVKVLNIQREWAHDSTKKELVNINPRPPQKQEMAFY